MRGIKILYSRTTVSVSMQQRVQGKESVFWENVEKNSYTIIDVNHCTTGDEMAGQAGHDERSGDSRQGRPRGGEATEWHPREPEAPEG